MAQFFYFLLAIIFLTQPIGAAEKKLVYCAGPLFNTYEREMMADIARAFEEAGYETFLPHRDGIEFSRVVVELCKMGLAEEQARHMISQAIFDLDAYQVAHRCDAVVCSLNGRVPDEGAVSECAIAWSFQKPVLYFKNDRRSLGYKQDNSLVEGLSQFEIVATIEQLPEALDRKFKNFPENHTTIMLKGPAQTQLERGAHLWRIVSKFKDSDSYLSELSAILCKFYGLSLDENPPYRPE